MSDADLAVIGGGPVGLAVAIEARLAGLTVVVIEPRIGPIDKACGEGLMPGAARALRRLGVDAAGRPLRGVAYVNEKTRVEHPFSVGWGRGVRRTALHAALAERAAQLGAARVTGRVESISQSSAAVMLAGKGVDVTVPWVVACDGLHSRARRLLGVETRSGPTRRRRFGVRRHFAREPWGDLVEVHWGRIESGAFEAYVTPVADDCVGVAVLGPPHIDFDETIAALPELSGRLAGAEYASETRGAGPLRQRATRQRVGRVLLAGDASGYVDALTGEGLRLGFEHAGAAVAAIGSGDLSAYESSWRRITRDYRVLTAGLVAAAQSPLRELIVPAAARLPKLYGAIVDRCGR